MHESCGGTLHTAYDIVNQLIMSTNNNNQGSRTPTHKSTIDEGWKNAGGSNRSKVSKPRKTTPAQTRSQTQRARSTSKPTSSKHDNVNNNSFRLNGSW